MGFQADFSPNFCEFPGIVGRRGPQDDEGVAIPRQGADGFLPDLSRPATCGKDVDFREPRFQNSQGAVDLGIRKGGLGNLLEEVYFGYKANSNQEADFPEAGVELKATPYEVTQKGELRAGERLVLTMINYDGPIEVEFYQSHAWEKMRLILLIYYWRNKQLNSNLLYKIGFVKMFTPPETDLEIIKKDYAYIVKTIQEATL